MDGNVKIKTGVVLTEDLRQQLEAEARRRTCSVSFLVRLACQELLQRHTGRQEEVA